MAAAGRLIAADLPPFLDYAFYDGYIAGAYQDFRGDTLDETLDKMNAWLADDSVIVVCEVTA